MTSGKAMEIRRVISALTEAGWLMERQDVNVIDFVPPGKGDPRWIAVQKFRPWIPGTEAGTPVWKLYMSLDALVADRPSDLGWTVSENLMDILTTPTPGGAK